MVKLYKILFTGRIHGVGFRYAVAQYAHKHGFVGTVKNISNGIEVIINDKDFLKNFDSSLMSRVESQTIEEVNIVGARLKDFRILGSEY
jgi:acylphosphatase